MLELSIFVVTPCFAGALLVLLVSRFNKGGSFTGVVRTLRDSREGRTAEALTSHISPAEAAGTEKDGTFGPLMESPKVSPLHLPEVALHVERLASSQLDNSICSIANNTTERRRPIVAPKKKASCTSTSDPGKIGQKPIPEYISDVSFMRGCIDECRNTHSYCRKKATPVNDRAVDNIFLIDLEDGHRLVEAPEGAPYLTLSYVWPAELPADHQGTVQVGQRISATSMSQLVKDVVSVARMLRYRYLWIDKYCIAQHDAGLMHRQIQQMRIVYRNAELCICALESDAEHRGLPGISRPRIACCLKRRASSTMLTGRRVSGSAAGREELYPFFLRNAHNGFVDAMSPTTASVQGLVKASMWWSRAWTYQEHLLSRRCLVFTEEQLYFECDASMCRCESDPRTGEPVTGIFQIMRPYPYYAPGVPPRVDDVLRAFLSHLEEYSKKTLRFHSQALNALVGVIKHHQAIHPRLHQVGGIPFFSKACKSRRRSLEDHWPDDEDEARMSDSALPYSLAWAHRGVGWGRPEQRPRPRTHVFPQWSPLGWVGEITYDWEGGVNFCDFETFADNFQLEVGGTAIPYQELYSGEEYARLSQFEKDTFSPSVLYMDSVALPRGVIGDVTFDSWSFGWTVCGRAALVSFSSAAESPKEVNEKLKSGELLALLLGGNGVCRNGSEERTLLLVVGRVDSGDGGEDEDGYARMGLLSIEWQLSKVEEYLEERGVDCTKRSTYMLR